MACCKFFNTLHNNIYRVLAYDQTGKNSIKSIQLGFNRNSISAIENVIVSSSNGYEIPTDFKRSESEFVEIALPNHPAIHELYPNPFNPFTHNQGVKNAINEWSNITTRLKKFLLGKDRYARKPIKGIQKIKRGRKTPSKIEVEIPDKKSNTHSKGIPDQYLSLIHI